MMKTLVIAAALLGACLGPVALAQPAQPPTGVTPIPTISATGDAQVSREPDQAEVSLGVQATGKTSAEAQNALNTVMDRVTKAVKGTNLPGLMVQTQGLGLYPEYERERQGAQTDAPRIIGYRASNTIRVRANDVARVGTIVDAGVAAGANQVLGISFSLKNDAEARREAIQKATAEAKAKCEAMAEALGVKLGRVMQANTGGVSTRPYRYNTPQVAFSRGAADMAPTPVEPGEVDVSASVTVEFAIEK